MSELEVSENLGSINPSTMADTKATPASENTGLNQMKKEDGDASTYFTQKVHIPREDNEVY